MTYRQLLKYLQEMDDDRLDDDVILYNSDTDKYGPIENVQEDILDDGHVVIVF